MDLKKFRKASILTLLPQHRGQVLGCPGLYTYLFAHPVSGSDVRSSNPILPCFTGRWHWGGLAYVLLSRRLIIAMYYLRPYLIRERDERERQAMVKQLREEMEKRKNGNMENHSDVERWSYKSTISLLSCGFHNRTLLLPLFNGPFHRFVDAANTHLWKYQFSWFEWHTLINWFRSPVRSIFSSLVVNVFKVKCMNMTGDITQNRKENVDTQINTASGD